MLDEENHAYDNEIAYDSNTYKSRQKCGDYQPLWQNENFTHAKLRIFTCNWAWKTIQKQDERT